MKTAVLISSDAALTGSLQSAAAQHDLLLLTATDSKDVKGLLLVQDGDTLRCYNNDGAEGDAYALTMPLRLGAAVDWLLRQLRRVPAIALGVHGQLEPQARRILQTNGNMLPLTEKEVDIIACLAAAAAPLPRDELMNSVWGYSPDADTHTLETHIYRLRQKLDAAGIGALLLSGDAGYYLART